MFALLVEPSVGEARCEVGWMSDLKFHNPSIARVVAMGKAYSNDVDVVRGRISRTTQYSVDSIHETNHVVVQFLGVLHRQGVGRVVPELNR